MDELDEVLDIQQRQKRAMIMRRYQSKIERAKEVAKSKMAPDKNIKKRAYAQARQIVRKRFAGQRGAEYEKLGPSEKMAIDRAIDKKQALIKKIALRLIPAVRKAEAQRLQSFTHGKTLDNHGAAEGHSKVNEDFNAFFAEKYDDYSANQLPDENKTQETKPAKKGKSKSQVKFYNKFGEEIVVSKQVFEALEKKAEKSGIDVDILGEVYSRGRDAWKDTGKVTQEQYAFARVNSFINQGRSYFEEDADLHGEELVEKRGLWDNIHAKRRRIKAGSGERMRKPGSKGAPTAQALKDAQESVEIGEGVDKNHPIVKEYSALKKHDIKTLRNMIAQHHKVVDTSEFKTKDHAVSHYLRQKHGNKKVDQAFGFNEETDLDEAKMKGKDPCWKGYQMVGKKTKNGKEVPNCVPESVQIEEENKYSVHQGKSGWYVNQHTGNGVWNHSVQTGYHDSKQKAVAWAKNHAGDRKHSITIGEEVEQIDELSSKTLFSYGKKARKEAEKRDEPMHRYSGRLMASKKTNPARGGYKLTKVAATFGEETEIQEAQTPMGKKIGTVNGYHIHDLGANTPHKDKRFLAYHHEYAYISHSAPTKTEITKKSKERDESKPTVKRTEHDDWRDSMKHRIQSGEIRRAVMSRRGMREETEIEESNNKPYVKPHIEKGSTQQSGWKASNKHGRVKYFGMDFKKSAEKHAGITESSCGCDQTPCDCESTGTKIRKKLEKVDRPPKTAGVYAKQAEIKNKIIDEEHPNCGTPECCGQCESAGNSQPDPAKRLVGTDSLVKAFKKDTPGQDINESFNIALAAGVGVTYTAADLGMRAQGGFQLHPSVIAEMQAREEEEIEEDVASAVKKPVYVPPIRKSDGTYTPAKTVLRKTGKKIIKGDGSSHDGQ